MFMLELQLCRVSLDRVFRWVWCAGFADSMIRLKNAGLTKFRHWEL